MPSLREIIRQEINLRGSIPFSRFMELALYCPETGYYERAEIGRHGDFYTSASTGALFGQLLARQFAKWLDELPAASVAIIEAGAHDGTLARDILGWLSRNRGDLFARLKYTILEPSERHRAWQRVKLDEFAAHIGWHSDWAPLGSQGVSGVLFSNELLDAFPIRRFGWDAGGRNWFEWGVAPDDEHFCWARIPIAEADFEAALAATGLDLPPELCAALPDDYTIEVAPTAREWWRAAAQTLGQGRLLTLDYGFTAEELIRPERADGTLRAYRKHSAVAHPLADPGESDLTAHVNFTQLEIAGEAAGLRTEGLVSQPAFLTGIAERLWTAPESGVGWSPREVRQFQTLTHPDHLGRAFRVLIQARVRRDVLR